MSAPRHPAKFNDVFIPVFADILTSCGAKLVLDPMAGVGKIAEVWRYGFNGKIVCNEIELEWAGQSKAPVVVGNAMQLPFPDELFDAIVTSPTYGNRLADHHNARDPSRRRSYRHDLGRPLHSANTGQLQWGRAYRRAHVAIWRECRRVLKPSGVLVVNVKNHIRRGKEVNVSGWHRAVLCRLGFRLRRAYRVAVPSLRYGANNKLRVPHEFIFVFQKGAEVQA